LKSAVPAIPPGPPGIANAPGASYLIPDINIPKAPPIAKPDRLVSKGLRGKVPPHPDKIVLNTLYQLVGMIRKEVVIP
jgi:hypothetical protein